MRGEGILPVLHPLKNELFPTEIRTRLGIIEACVLLSGCISVITFPQLKNYLGITGLCIVYVMCSCNVYSLAPNGPEKRGCRMRIRDLFIKIRDLFSTTRLKKQRVHLHPLHPLVWRLCVYFMGCLDHSR